MFRISSSGPHTVLQAAAWSDAEREKQENIWIAASQPISGDKVLLP